jgi:nucleoside-diphosphate-sugar epimerase
MDTKVLVTGGAGYIGSSLVAALLKRGDRVTVLDDLWFGGESLLPFVGFDTFRLIKRDMCNDVLPDIMRGIDSIVHLAAIVGFPACAKAGRERVWRINVDGTKKIYQAAEKADVKRMVLASSYSNYGESKQDEPVTEESSLNPQSIYAESKIEAERFLLNQTNANDTAPICLRLATVFGLSPRTRFDLILNQFVLEAYLKGRLELYQENFKRSFVHVRDVVRAIICVMDSPLQQVRNQIFNVGSERLNSSKQELVEIIRTYLPQLKVKYRDASITGDMRSIHVSFQKIRKVLQYETQIDLKQGIEEILWALRAGVISDPLSEKYRNHPAILL